MSDGSAKIQTDQARPAIAVFRSPAFNATEGFIQTQAFRLIHYRPLVVALERKGNIIPALEGRLLLPRSRWERIRLTFFGDAGPIARRLREEAPILVHAHFATDGLIALPLARALAIPLITTLRGYDITRSRRTLFLSGRASWMRYALFRRKLMEQGSLFLTVSDALRMQAIAQGYPADRTITHYNGVDLKRFRPMGEPAGKIVLHVGRLVEKKGTLLLLHAFAAVARADPEARLVIIGDGPLRPKLEQETRRAGLAGSVRFLGTLAPAEVIEWMQKASLLACPSLTAGDGDAEGLPNAVVEASACGLPIIASRHSGIPEALIDGETGFLVAEGDVESLSARLLDVLQSPARQAAMGIAARRLAEKKFDLDRQMEKLERIYREVTATSGSQAVRSAANRVASVPIERL